MTIELGNNLMYVAYFMGGSFVLIMSITIGIIAYSFYKMFGRCKR